MPILNFDCCFFFPGKIFFLMDSSKNHWSQKISRNKRSKRTHFWLLTSDSEHLNHPKSTRKFFKPKKNNDFGWIQAVFQIFLTNQNISMIIFWWTNDCFSLSERFLKIMNQNNHPDAVMAISNVVFNICSEIPDKRIQNQI